MVRVYLEICAEKISTFIYHNKVYSMVPNQTVWGIPFNDGSVLVCGMRVYQYPVCQMGPILSQEQVGTSMRLDTEIVNLDHNYVKLLSLEKTCWGTYYIYSFIRTKFLLSG